MQPADEGTGGMTKCPFNGKWRGGLSEPLIATLAIQRRKKMLTINLKNAHPQIALFFTGALLDRSINPDQERMMAKRAKAKTVEVNSSHVAYMSHPKETAKLIEEAANSAHVSQ